MKKDQKGFSVVEILIIIVALALLGFIGFWVWQKNHQKSPSAQKAQETLVVNTQQKQPSLKSYTIENEELSFSYNPDKSVIKSSGPDQIEGLYMIKTNVITGSSTLTITAGIDGIGGGPFCGETEREICEVVDTTASTFLGKPVTYRLIKAQQPINCGYDGVPSCDEAKLTTSYAIDSVKGTGGPFGPCCGIFNAEARNIGGKAKVPGSLLIGIEAAQGIQNNEMLKNKDIIETLKIIESLKYKQ